MPHEYSAYPWTWTECGVNDHLDGLPLIFDAQDLQIAEVHGEYNGQRDANALLMCTAPLLLEEHEKTLGWLLHIKGQITAPPSVMLGFDQAIRATQAVIKQAKGEK